MIPELGIGKSALKEIEKIILNSSHPRHKLVAPGLERLKNNLQNIELIKATLPTDERLTALRDQFNHEAIRLLTIAQGATSLLHESLPARLYLETLLLDSVIQTPQTFIHKISMIAPREV